jgi:hypothetical protein
MSDCGHTPLYSEDFARGGVERMPCYFCQLAALTAERDALKAECHGRRYDLNLVEENKRLRAALVEACDIGKRTARCAIYAKGHERSVDLDRLAALRAVAGGGK